MITKEDYINYFGVETAPINFKRLEQVAINELRAVMVRNVPNSDDIVFIPFKNALLEEIYYLDMNSDLLISGGSGSYSLGSYSENSSSQNLTKDTISRVSPIAYDILLNSGLLYCGI